MPTAYVSATTATVPLPLPILDRGPYLQQAPGVLERLAGARRDALEHIGFFFLINHGIPQHLIDRVFAEAVRFHPLPLEDKMPLALSPSLAYDISPLDRERMHRHSTAGHRNDGRALPPGGSAASHVAGSSLTAMAWGFPLFRHCA